jgi:dTDP-4-dehydrorhamnose reductase
LSHKDVEITNEKEISRQIDEHNPDIVINSVAIIGINLCEKEPQKTFDINAIAVSNLAKICDKKKIILVQPSTHAVFDGKKDEPYTEDDIPNPINIYGVSKYCAECFTKNICKKHYIIRFPTLFGPRRNTSLGFADKMISRIINREEIKAPYDKIDSLSYTMDLANLLIKLLEEKKSFGIYHFTNQGSMSFYDFVIKLKSLMKMDAKVMKVKEASFDSIGKTSLKTAIKSVKSNPIRKSEDALAEYISTLDLKK